MWQCFLFICKCNLLAISLFVNCTQDVQSLFFECNNIINVSIWKFFRSHYGPGVVSDSTRNEFPVKLRPNAGHGLLILEVSRSHTTTHHSR